MKTGLAWGTSPSATPEDELDAATTSYASASDGVASIQLTDVMGQRTVRVEAKVTISSQDYTVIQDVTFGNGPLAAFAGPPYAYVTWKDAGNTCGTTAGVDLYVSGYKAQTKLPEIDTLRMVAQGNGGNGAAYAAGWDTVAANYWTGVIIPPTEANPAEANDVALNTGLPYTLGIGYLTGAVCLP
jgi:hypothetical protein